MFFSRFSLYRRNTCAYLYIIEKCREKKVPLQKRNKKWTHSTYAINNTTIFVHYETLFYAARRHRLRYNYNIITVVPQYDTIQQYLCNKIKYINIIIEVMCSVLT